MISMLRQNRSVAILAGGRVGQIALQLVFMRAITERLSVDEVGRYYLILTLVSAIQLLSVTPVVQYCERRLYEWRMAGLGFAYLIGYIAFLVAAAGGMMLLVVVGGALDAADFLRIEGIGTAAVLQLLASSLLQMVTGASNFVKRRGQAVALQLLGLTVGIVCAWVATGGGETVATRWIIGLALGQFGVALTGVALLIPAIRPDSPRSERGWQALRNAPGGALARLTAFVAPLMLINALYWLQSQAYRLITGEMLGESALGVFQVAYTVSASALLACESVLQMLILPHFYRECAGQEPAEIARIWQTDYVERLLPLLLLVCTFVAFGSPLVLSLLVDEKFWPAYPFAMLAGAAETVRLIGALFYTCALAQERTRSAVTPVALQAAIALSIVFVLVPFVGLYGVGVALLLSYLANVAWWFFVRREYWTQLRLIKVRRAAPYAAVSAAVLGGGLVAWGNANIVLNCLLLCVAALVSALGLRRILPDLPLARWV